MKVPSSATAIPLILGPDPTSPTTPQDQAEDGEEPQHKSGVDLVSGQSLQKVVSFELKEEGSHVLAVTVTYTETTPTSGRVRTFRKLYQFVCKGCMVVRTKAGLLPAPLSEEDNGGVKRGRHWALEAQLENIGEETITLDMVILETREGFKSKGINWEVVREGEELEKPVLMPGDVQQVCFIVEEVLDEEGQGQEIIDGRILFGILSMGWRGPMGNRGYLSTGSLGARV
jgi:trafficking protein particle complex subunit 13